MKINNVIAFLIARLILGLIFLMQGFGKIFTWGLEKVYNADFFYGTFNNLLPEFVIQLTVYYTSYVELIGGALLVIGLKTNYTLYLLASVLVIVSFGHGLAEPIWELSHVMYRTILLLTLLVMPKEWNKFSVDYLIERSASNKFKDDL